MGAGTEHCVHLLSPTKDPPPAQIRGSIIVSMPKHEAGCGVGVALVRLSVRLGFPQCSGFGPAFFFPPPVRFLPVFQQGQSVAGQGNVSSFSQGAGHLWQSLWSFVAIAFAS